MICDSKAKILTRGMCSQRRRSFGRTSSVGIAHGCFDVLTPAHVRFLQDAACNCSILVVSVSSDAVAKRLKGDNRPTFGIKDRMEHLAALECVDYVIECDEDDASGLIKELAPVSLLKGHDSVESTAPGFLLEKEAVNQSGGRVIYVVAGAQSHSSELIEALGQTHLVSASFD